MRAAEEKGLPPPSRIKVVSMRAATKELGEALRLTAYLAAVASDHDAEERALARADAIGGGA